MVRVSRRALLLPVLLLACFTGRGLSAPLRFPLTNDACPTSSFGSWRSGHLHAGLDFSTGGVTGIPVLAVDSCLVWRIRLWNGGYGKALYAELADGKTAVYGHLSRFIPEIETLVEAEQDRLGKYEVELLLESERLRFGPGDILAFSGDTGSGPPHLHFELRSGREDHDKINPVPDYMDLAEAEIPVIKSIRLVPLGPGSRINGVYTPVTVVPGRDMKHLEIAGPFGAAVYAADPVQCGRVLKPVHYGALIDQVPVFQLSFDRFPFSKGHYVGGFYEPVGGAMFVRLYDDYRLDFRGFNCRVPEGPEPAGLLDPGEHQLVVSVADPWGNTREAVVPFVYGALPAFKRFRLLRDSTVVGIEIEAEPTGTVAAAFYRRGGDWQALGGGQAGLRYVEVPLEEGERLEVKCTAEDPSGLVRQGLLATGGRTAETDTSVGLSTVVHPGFLEIYVTTGSAPSSLPLVFFHQASGVTSLLLQPEGESVFRGTFLPGGDGGPFRIVTRVDFDGSVVERVKVLRLGVLKPGRAISFSTRDYRINLTAPPGYSSQTLITVSEEQARLREGFVSSGGRLVFEPVGVFLGERVEVLVVRKDGGPGAGVGVFAEHGERVSFRGGFDDRGWCRFSTRQPEHLVILEDRDGPEFGPVADLRRRLADGKATFASMVSDGGSGVDAGSLRAFVDDEAAIISVDPDTGRLSGRTTKPLPYGEHRIRLEAEDRLGNASIREFTVNLSR